LRFDFSNDHLLYSLFSWYILAYTIHQLAPLESH
jgi:hypothetical protein